jgi:hypothetical protein
LPPNRIVRIFSLRKKDMTKTELLLQDLKKQRQAVYNQIVNLEQDHLFTFLPLEVKDSIIETYLVTEEVLADGIQKLEELVQVMKVNEGLGIRN